METTRRQFLKSLLATAATAAIAPQVLIEPVHGASDLSAHERDAVADVMGLRSKQWRGHVVQLTKDCAWRQNVLIKTNAPPEHINCRCIRIALLRATTGCDGGDAFRQAILEQAEQNLYDSEPKII